MTNTEPPNPQAPPAPSNKRLMLEVLKATGIPLMFGLLCLVGLALIWWYGLPARPISIVALSALIAGPFIVSYAFLFAYIYQKRLDVPIVLNDPDGQEWGLKYLHPKEFGEAEIEGDRLATRHARSTGETVYFAEGQKIEQREEVNPETGETEIVPRRVLVSTWEGEVSHQEFMESKAALSKQREKLVPLAFSGLQARAGADMKVLENTDRLGHALLLGAEEGNFLADGDNPMNFDLDVDLDETLGGLLPHREEADDQEERAAADRPGSADIQESDDSLEERAASREAKSNGDTGAVRGSIDE
ncbi:hypothetical protein [Halosimplex amylolyticum]|uniref:hypothetical protein n=1 Tax=Halosimplex amylolyticum TaxID=3396616 RepID=UPI003F546524